MHRKRFIKVLQSSDYRNWYNTKIGKIYEVILWNHSSGKEKWKLIEGQLPGNDYTGYYVDLIDALEITSKKPIRGARTIRCL